MIVSVLSLKSTSQQSNNDKPIFLSADLHSCSQKRFVENGNGSSIQTPKLNGFKELSLSFGRRVTPIGFWRLPYTLQEFESPQVFIGIYENSKLSLSFRPKSQPGTLIDSYVISKCLNFRLLSLTFGTAFIKIPLRIFFQSCIIY